MGGLTSLPVQDAEPPSPQGFQSKSQRASSPQCAPPSTKGSTHETHHGPAGGGSYDRPRGFPEDPRTGYRPGDGRRGAGWAAGGPAGEEAASRCRAYGHRHAASQWTGSHPSAAEGASLDQDPDPLRP